MTIVYKTLNENEPQYLADKCSSKAVDKSTRYNISNIKQLEVPFNRKRTKGDRGFSITGPSYWNKLPNYIKEAREPGQIQETPKSTFLDHLLINH